MLGINDYTIMVVFFPKNCPLLLKIYLAMTAIAFAVLAIYILVAILLRIIRDKKPEKRAKIDPFLKKIGALNKNA